MVSYSLDNRPDGTFDLFVEASLGDNAGIASYSFPLIGDILTIDHNSPNAIGTGPIGNQQVAFGFLRSSDGNTMLTATQDTINPGYIVYGMGQSGGDIAEDATPIPDSIILPEQPVYGVPLMIASGTWNTAGTPPAVDVDSIELGANVFIADTGLGTTEAMVVPEPTGLGLAAAGLCGLVVLRRRASHDC